MWRVCGALRPVEALCAAVRRSAAVASPGKPLEGGRSAAESRLRLADLTVGQQLEGTVVQIYCPGGVSVEVGCQEALGFLEVEEFRDGFPFEGPFSFQRGQEVTVRVLDVDPSFVFAHGEPDPHGDHGDSGRLHLTMRTGSLERPRRYVADTTRPAKLEPFKGIAQQEWLEGEVVMMSNWAVYVKVQGPGGDPFVGILYQEDFASVFEKDAIRGLTVRVRIKELDLQCRRMVLTMRDP